MRSKQIGDVPNKTWVLVLDDGDEVVGVLTEFADQQDLTAAYVNGVGGMSSAMLGRRPLCRAPRETRSPWRGCWSVRVGQPTQIAPLLCWWCGLKGR